MVVLTKTQSVLDYDQEGFGQVRFVSPDDKDEFDQPRKDFWFAHETYADLGEPDTITVTIEPGDKLND